MAYALEPAALYDYSNRPTVKEEFALGTKSKGSDGAIRMYVLAAAAIAIGGTAKITKDFTITTLNTTVSASAFTPCGVAEDAAFASGEYGWVVVEGPCTPLMAASISNGDQLTTTATDNTVGAGGDSILGFYAAAASGSGGRTAATASPPFATNS